MKKFFGFYLIVTVVYAAMLMQRTAELQGGYVSVDYLSCLLFLIKGLMWPLAIVRWLF
ncbi:MAG: hypothetical protein WBG77_14680 [Acinetobacter venetianus]|uniref:Uncharacterized protein n=1 Tax=Acinetobacter venetianus (strain ATCC 31012 / DSM 23050 / BCRC 14357 / CCUG 45561 / CIP 110063 / KCTC 2702 / LMG 19082 / RAG-1) TaxID=1191460 RepID=N8ZXE8_ACIVR|nr:hypothetical protein F959_02391 [Acinetobacter venetianus RAG-1 = CIP 110063]MBC9227759.1 hypothetical protein [Acinetobacter baumannii]